MNPDADICHITTVHPPFDQRIFFRECVSASTIYSTTLICHYNKKEEIIKDVKIVSIGKNKTRTLSLKIFDRLITNLHAIKKSLEKNYVIYHLHDPELIIVGFIIKKLIRRKVIFDCHEDYLGYIQQRVGLKNYQRKILLFIFRNIEKLAIRNFDVIITADQGMGNRYLEFGAKKVEVIFNFPRLEFFNYFPEPESTEYDLVYNGSIPRYHLNISFDVAEELIKRGHYLKWYFFGRCPEIEWARSVIIKRNLEKYFFILPSVSHDQVSIEIRKAKIGFIPLPDLPKFKHNIPTKLFEFMALGMPTVLSDLPPSREFVGDGKCAIMVDPNDVNAYANAIIKLMKNRAMRISMGVEGRKKIENHYNWKNEEAKLLRLYSELLNE